jgi:peptidoglycan biosynthesis protein MviN/MurJ (putative lipid II flippase)
MAICPIRFSAVSFSLFGVAMASALLPSIARSAAAHNFEEFRKHWLARWARFSC